MGEFVIIAWLDADWYDEYVGISDIEATAVFVIVSKGENEREGSLLLDRDTRGVTERLGSPLSVIVMLLLPDAVESK